MKRPAQLSKAFVDRVQDIGTYGDGRGSYGLTLLVRPRAGGGTRKIFSQRLTLDGSPIRIGLGSYPITSLEEARDQAFNNRRQVRDGVDPRQKARLVPPIFADALERVIESHQDSWKSGRLQADKWRSMFRRYAQPLMRKRVDRISGGDLHSVLLPVWKAKRATAKHLVMRVGMVMRWAIAQEYRVDKPCQRSCRPGATTGRRDCYEP